MTLTGDNNEEKAEIRSVERTRRGFVIHFGRGVATMRVKPSDRRRVEAAFRSLGVVIVDEWGAQIEESQFAKEADPQFNRNVDDGLPSFWVALLTPNWYLRYRHRRLVRQSSDDA
jgi:hypothetical protein